MNLKLFFLSACLSIALIADAQTRKTIIDELTKYDYSGGTVTIECDSQIKALIGTPLSETKALNESYVKIQGFRVQVFSGTQRQSKDEAEQKAREVKEVFPEISIYVTYKAPIWRLRVGDFPTREEANAFIRELKKKLPSLGREANIMPDEIKVFF